MSDIYFIRMGGGKIFKRGNKVIREVLDNMSKEEINLEMLKWLCRFNIFYCSWYEGNLVSTALLLSSKYVIGKST